GGVAEGFLTARLVEDSEVISSYGILLGTKGTASGTGDGHVDAWSIMANAWYEFELGNSQWKPYLGGGIGIAWVSLNGRGTITPNFGSETEDLASVFIDAFFGGAEGFIGPATQHHINIDAKESGFAWQLGAGIGYEFAPNKQITLDYRYFRGPEIDSVRFAFTSNTDLDLDYDYKAHSLMIGMKAGF
ncbi:MAG: porin family protein, partial [Alphaproteobacteria bacterium]